MRIRKTQVLLGVGDREPVLHEDDARAHQHALEFRHGVEELLDVGLAAKAHDPLDAGRDCTSFLSNSTISPGHPAGGPRSAGNTTEYASRSVGADSATVRQMRGLSRWVTRLITAALAGGVRGPRNSTTTLSLWAYHPVLQLDELALQAQQLGEIQAAVDDFRPGNVGQVIGQARHEVVAELQLELLVEAVGQFLLDAILETSAGSFSMLIRISSLAPAREFQ